MAALSVPRLLSPLLVAGIFAFGQPQQQSPLIARPFALQWPQLECDRMALGSPTLDRFLRAGLLSPLKSGGHQDAQRNRSRSYQFESPARPIPLFPSWWTTRRTPPAVLAHWRKLGSGFLLFAPRAKQ